jgi:hypothetical protein
MPSLPQPFSPLRLSRTELWTLLALVLACRLVSLWALPLQDDAFITFRYARNWAAGLGLAYNPGEPWEPVLGISTLGFTGILALGSRLGCDPTWLARVIDVGCDLGSAWLLLELLDRRRIAGGATLLAFAFLPQLNRCCAGGLEAPLFTLLALGAALALQRKRWRLSGTLGALATSVRPEGLLLLAWLLVRAARRRAELARLALPVLAIGGTLCAWMLATYGALVPHALSRLWGSRAPLDSPAGLLRAAEALQHALCAHPSYALFLPLVLLGAWRSLRRGAGTSTVSLVALSMTIGYAASGVHSVLGFFHLPLAAWCLWLGAGCEALVGRLHARLSEDTLELGRQRAIVFGGAVLFFAFAALSAMRRDALGERVYEPLQARARAIGRVEPRARILAANIGALGWAWSGTVLDSEGRTWPSAVLYGEQNQMIRECAPEYLLIDAERGRIGFFRSDDELCARYVAVARFAANGARELEPELQDLPLEWAPDYLLYRRRDFEDTLAR